jgi:hypothetical protein
LTYLKASDRQAGMLGHFSEQQIQVQDMHGYRNCWLCFCVGGEGHMVLVGATWAPKCCEEGYMTQVKADLLLHGLGHRLTSKAHELLVAK